MPLIVPQLFSRKNCSCLPLLLEAGVLHEGTDHFSFIPAIAFVRTWFWLFCQDEQSFGPAACSWPTSAVQVLFEESAYLQPTDDAASRETAAGITERGLEVLLCTSSTP